MSFKKTGWVQATIFIIILQLINSSNPRQAPSGQGLRQNIMGSKKEFAEPEEELEFVIDEEFVIEEILDERVTAGGIMKLLVKHGNPRVYAAGERILRIKA